MISEHFEEYIQISTAVAQVLPGRLPMTLYTYDNGIDRVAPLFKKETVMSSRRKITMMEVCSIGLLFISRKDYKRYAEVLANNLALMLSQDQVDLREGAEIFYKGLVRSLRLFMDAPTREHLEPLVRDIAFLCEYVWGDKARLDHLYSTLLFEDDAVLHGVNTMFTGLYLFERMVGLDNATDAVEYLMGLALHDLGMTQVSQVVREKDGPLFNQERESMRKHVEIGLRIMDRLRIRRDSLAMRIMAAHHERVDGGGYPMRRKEDGLDLHIRMACVADSYCAMVSRRPYREPMTPVTAIKTLMGSEGYDAAIVRQLINMVSTAQVLEEEAETARRTQTPARPKDGKRGLDAASSF